VSWTAVAERSGDTAFGWNRDQASSFDSVFAKAPSPLRSVGAVQDTLG